MPLGKWKSSIRGTAPRREDRSILDGVSAGFFHGGCGPHGSDNAPEVDRGVHLLASQDHGRRVRLTLPQSRMRTTGAWSSWPAPPSNGPRGIHPVGQTPVFFDQGYPPGMAFRPKDCWTLWGPRRKVSRLRQVSRRQRQPGRIDEIRPLLEGGHTPSEFFRRRSAEESVVFPAPPAMRGDQRGKKTGHGGSYSSWEVLASMR